MIEKRKVVKRDGRIVDFDSEKIVAAVEAAFNSVNQSLPPRLLRSFIKDITVNLPDPVSVEDIQNKVERKLMDSKYFQAAKAFILYREKHRELRDIAEDVNYMDWYTHNDINAATSSNTDPNSNVSAKNVANLDGEVPKKRNREIQRYRMQKQLKKMYSKELADQYIDDIENKRIYIHDEAAAPTVKPYCMADSLYSLLAEGTGKVDNVTPSAPNDLWSFSGQVGNLLFLMASQVKGAVAFGEYFVALNYYVVQEFGPDWYQKLDASATSGVCNIQRTVRSFIKKAMKQFIYFVNQPMGNRSFNSPL